MKPSTMLVDTNPRCRALLALVFGLFAGCTSSNAGSSLPDAAGGTDAGTDAAKDATLPVDAASQGPGQVQVQGGTLAGIEAAEQTLAFLGIPFAAPPVGELRFRAPVAPEPWSGVRAADRFPEPCLQATAEPAGLRGSEDCLYLNVWRPARDAAAPRPVLVFIHGGGNVTGSTTEEVAGARIYEGAALAGRFDVVVVTIQYRLNILGYAADPALDEPGTPSGNYGPRDQLAALAWVRANIAAFGGDPDAVMLFGESGGGTDVCALLATPAAAGLFSRAVVMSGGCGGKARPAVVSWTASVAGAVGCDGADRAACLRVVTADKLVAAAARPATQTGAVTTPAGPTVDGAFLPEPPIDAFRAGRHHHVAVAVGVTADETSSRLFGIPFGLTEQQYETRVRAMFAPALAEAALAEYSVARYKTPRAALVALTTDLQFVCPSLVAVRALRAAQDLPVHHYVYAHAFEGKSAGTAFPLAAFGAAHGFELMFLFQTLDRLDGYAATAAEVALERLMGSYWTSFARDGAPLASGGPAWPAVGTEPLRSLELKPSPAVVEDYRADRCAFWASWAP